TPIVARVPGRDDPSFRHIKASLFRPFTTGRPFHALAIVEPAARELPVAAGRVVLVVCPLDHQHAAGVRCADRQPPGLEVAALGDGRRDAYVLDAVLVGADAAYPEPAGYNVL